jgi:hypothetical protein
MSLTSVNPTDYNIVRGPFGSLYQELAWYRGASDRLLGLILCDRLDNDFSWVVLTADATGLYRTVDLHVSLPTQADATAALEVDAWSAQPAAVAEALGLAAEAATVPPEFYENFDAAVQTIETLGRTPRHRRRRR